MITNHFAVPDDLGCLEKIRELMRYLPQNNMEDPLRMDSSDNSDRRDETLREVVPVDPNRPCDIRGIVRSNMDDTYFFEVHEHWARNIVVGFGRLDGMPVGVVDSQPSVMAGCLDIDASNKAARFVRFCDVFNIPL